jgi:hypothetical protein
MRVAQSENFLLDVEVTGVVASEEGVGGDTDLQETKTPVGL